MTGWLRHHSMMVCGDVVLHLTTLALMEYSPSTHLAIIWIYIYSSRQGADMIRNTSKLDSYFSLHTEKLAFWFLCLFWIGWLSWLLRDSGNSTENQICNQTKWLFQGSEWSSLNSILSLTAIYTLHLYF